MPNRSRDRYLPEPMIGFLDYWVARMRSGQPPIRDADFSAAALKPWLGHLSLIEQTEDGDFRFRLAGTKLLRRFGQEVTGRSFREVDAQVLGDLKSGVLEAIGMAVPVVQRGITGDEKLRFHDLLAPLANSEGEISLVILVSYMEAVAPKDPLALEGRAQSSDLS